MARRLLVLTLLAACGDAGVGATDGAIGDASGADATGAATADAGGADAAGAPVTAWIGDVLTDDVCAPFVVPPVGPGNGAMRKLTLTDPDALCNDGTPAVIYVKRATSPAFDDRWVIHLEAGGGCDDHESCMERWCGHGFYTAAKMSSAWAPAGLPATGIMRGTGDTSFGDGNLVFMDYCSSDEWHGRNSDATLAPQDGDVPPYRVALRGHSILEAALAEFQSGAAASDDGTVTLPDIDGASAVLFTGSSAGSGGVAANLDWFAGQLPAGVVRGVRDAVLAPRFDLLPDDVATTLTDARQARYAHDVDPAFANAALDESCLAYHDDQDDWMCDDPTHLAYHHLTTPFFQRMDLTDANALDTFLALGVTKAEFATATRQTLLDLAAADSEEPRSFVPAVYGPNCGQHIALMNDDYFAAATVIGAAGAAPMTFEGALQGWMDGDPIEIVDALPPDGTSTCP